MRCSYVTLTFPIIFLLFHEINKLKPNMTLKGTLKDKELCMYKILYYTYSFISGFRVQHVCITFVYLGYQHLSWIMVREKKAFISFYLMNKIVIFTLQHPNWKKKNQGSLFPQRQIVGRCSQTVLVWMGNKPIPSMLWVTLKYTWGSNFLPRVLSTSFQNIKGSVDDQQTKHFWSYTEPLIEKSG